MAKYEIKDGVGIIPEGTTEIEWEAFDNCTELTSVVIQNSVTKIGALAFHGCTNLTNVIIPGSVEILDSRAFYGCTSLAKIQIPDSVTIICNNAFEAVAQEEAENEGVLIDTYDIEGREDCKLHKVGLVVPKINDGGYVKFKKLMQGSEDDKGREKVFVEQIKSAAHL